MLGKLKLHIQGNIYNNVGGLRLLSALWSGCCRFEHSPFPFSILHTALVEQNKTLTDIIFQIIYQLIMYTYLIKNKRWGVFQYKIENEIGECVIESTT